MGTPKKQVYLFGTCLIDVFYPNAGLDAISLLELCGYEVIFPSEQTCCGQPPYNSGFKSSAIDVAKQTIQTFCTKDIPLIVPSASCAGMIKHHYPLLFKKLETNEQNQYQQKALALSERTFELIDFIADKLPFDQQTVNTPCKVSLHESCCAQREMMVSESWRAILERLNNVEVNLPDYAAECCGFGGTFSVKSAAISAAMTQDKSLNLQASKPDFIVSGDSGCLMNIGEHIKQENQLNPCLHLASFVARRFGIEHAD